MIRPPTHPRLSFVFTLIAVLSVLLPPSALRSQQTPRFDTPSALRVGDRTSVVLQLEADSLQSVLITPSSDGAAVRVARGRLFLRDGSVEGGILRVPIPLIAEQVGVANLHANIQAHRCRDERCWVERSEGEVALRVLRP